MKLYKLLICPLILAVSLSIGCNKENVTQSEVTTNETVDCSFASPETGAPLNLIARSSSLNHVELTWSLARVTSSYKIYRNDVLIGSTQDDSYFDYYDFSPETKYTYYVFVEATSKKSRLITLTTHAGYLSETTPQDNYTLTLDADCWLSLGITKDVNLDLSNYSALEIYNSSGSTKIYSTSGPSIGNTIGGGGGLNIKAGTYIIRLNRTAGKGNFNLKCYTIGTIYSGDTEPNDTKENSILVQTNTIVNGHIGFNGETPNSPDLVDFFRIDIPSSKNYAFTINKSSEVNFNQEMDLGVSILKNDGLTPVTEFNTIGTNNITKQISLTTGTYYIKVTRGFAWGGYQFKMCSGD
ncbi:MAG: hypothetical protein JST55_13815 [Bacteroidetes bacterium]|nr:hypothetical protein [Bacteroidota bacterium]